jgi:hypothetical protein
MEATKTDNKYSKAKIYTVRSHRTEQFYIGSTIQQLHKRLHGHRLSYKYTPNHYVTCFEILKFDDNYIELLEDYPCENINQLLRREGELIRLHKNNAVNVTISGRTHKEYYQDNKAVWQAKQKTRYEENKVDILEKQKDYYSKHTEIFKIKNKAYRDEKKEEIKQQRTAIIECECGSTFQKTTKARHCRSIKHQDYIKSLL